MMIMSYCSTKINSASTTLKQKYHQIRYLLRQDYKSQKSIRQKFENNLELYSTCMNDPSSAQ